MRDPCDSHRSDLDQKRRQNVLRTLMTEIRDPRSEIRDPCDSHRSDLDQKRRQNVLRTLMTEIREPRSVRQSQIRFRPEKMC